MNSPVYRYYVLALLVTIYAFNFLDRQVVTIIAPYLKADMGVSDAQIGLLFGTAFALFYAVFGLPLAKLADGWSRVKTLALGLSFWSFMTAVSGMTANFGQLALARVGVGVGEASASPAAYSLLQDYFPKSMRATVLAIYGAGIYVGAGAALVLGGKIALYWDANYTAATAPFGLAGWQATYLAFGIPGILLALLMILTVKEPVRGAIDGMPTPGDPTPVKSVLREFAAMLPPWNLAGYDAAGKRRNLLMMAGITIAVVLTITLTDAMLAPAKRAVIGTIGTWGITTNMVQWVAIGLGVYCASSWVQTIKTRDPASFALMTNRGFVSLAMTGGLMSYISYGLSPFIVLYVMKRFDLGPETGVTLGYVTVVCGATGAALGGVIGDWLKRRYPAGRMMVMLFACIASTLLVLGSFMVGDVRTFFVLSGLQIGLHIMWLGPCAASIQDLVLPRMRGTATAVFFLATTIIGLGLGPYLTGLISDVTGDLRTALLATLVVVPLILLSIAIAWRSVPALEESLIARAKAAGEPLDG